MACFVVGITGGIASGKSLVSAMLEARGMPLVDADVVSRRLVKPGSPLLQKLGDVFGAEIFVGGRSDKPPAAEEAELDRKYLGQLVFSDPKKLERLNFIMHPAIWQACFSEISLRARGFAVVGLVAPLLLEQGASAMVDSVWVVDIPEEVQIVRLMARDRLTEDEAKQRLSVQMSRKERLGFADVIINNNCSIEETASQVDTLWREQIASRLRTASQNV